MTIDIEQVRRIFLLYADLPPREGARWDVLCRGAASALQGRLRADLPQGPETAERLAAAAAAWACGDYLRLAAGASGLGQELKVGDISVKSAAGAGGDGAALRACALESVADLIRGHGPVFRAVGGEEG